ncbi:hypothetical protein M408DRAFT_332936 [Serendipita vermifera MAFF 305830]|uniref:Uncharacterized protein n=1 Tax=Serendipita vermifera MAFF 305830 TaxID=933852 RepID=A0A0C2W7K4_SERVB|nr:hypothetical protein M408DRAFT_332936 [Serendipita vermifera MAFF 305830]
MIRTGQSLLDLFLLSPLNIPRRATTIGTQLRLVATLPPQSFCTCEFTIIDQLFCPVLERHPRELIRRLSGNKGKEDSGAVLKK